MILSLAVMTVGGGMMLFVYAFSKAHKSLNEGARVACLAETLEVSLGGELLAMRGLAGNKMEATLKMAEGFVIAEIDRCSGEVLSQQTISFADPSALQTP